MQGPKLTPEEQALLDEYQRRVERDELATRCRASLYEFTVAAWPVLEPSAPFILNWHIKAICDAIQAVLEDWDDKRKGKIAKARMQNLLINIPPGTAKSRIVCVMAPCWFWLRCPDWRAIFFSGNPRVAARDSVYRRDLLESQWYRETFKPAWALKQDQNAKLQFNNDAGGFHSALTAGQKIIGDRGDALFVDDPNDATEVDSDEVRTNLNEIWWDQGAANRLNDPQTSVRIGIMQRLHEDDWAGHVLQQKSAGGYIWWHLCFMQEYEPETRCPCGREKCETPLGKLDPRTAPGELLFPARFPKHILDEERERLGANGYAGQHQQHPYAKGGGQIKKEWFKFYTEDPEKMVFDEIYQSWDMTFKKTKSSDFVVGQVWGIRGPRRYLLDQVRARMDFPETVKAVKLLSKRWPKAVAKYIEDKANGSGVIASLRAELEGIIPVNPEGGKEARASAVAPLIEAGNVYLPSKERCPWVEGLLGECEAFPNGLHDDQVDAMTQALVKTIDRRYAEVRDDRTPNEKLWDSVAAHDRREAAERRMVEELGFADDTTLVDSWGFA
jgi:predicted phage terminase large subunit-like protein